MINTSTVNRIARMMPAQESVTLNSRLQTLASGENTYKAFSCPRTRREPANKAILELMGAQLDEVWWTFEIYNTTSIAAVPKVGDTITDLAGIIYQVRYVDINMIQTIYACHVLQNL